MKILHIITCLDDGGAEAVLCRLIASMPDCQHFVVSLRGLGKYFKTLQDNSAEVVALEMDTWQGFATALFRLYKLTYRWKPDAIQSWMYHANLFASICSCLFIRKKLVWGLHCSDVSILTCSTAGRVVHWLCVIFSKFSPHYIVSCSAVGLDSHVRCGYSAGRMRHIPNGCPSNLFLPSPNAGLNIRKILGIDSSDVLIGMVARYHPMKDHHNFLSAIKIASENLNFKCVLVGKGLQYGSAVHSHALALGLSDKVFFRGQRDDMCSVFNALDIFCLSSSSGEAFPTVLCEAMSCGVPCITTDVGDSSIIVGSAGWVVPPSNPFFLSSALEKAVELVLSRSNELQALKREARSRIVRLFSMDSMRTSYHDLWR